MKKKLLLLMALSLLSGIKTFAYDAQIDGIYYNFSSNEATVTYQYTDYGYYSSPNYSESVVIPESVMYNGKTYYVTTIGNHAFCNCTGLKSITIPSSLKKVETSAFKMCTSLTKIIVPDIAAWCGIIYEGTDYNGDFPLGHALHLYSDENTEITEVVIPEGVTRIEPLAFRDAKYITSVTIPKTVSYIGSEAFRGMHRLTSINLPQSITSINPYAFDDCQALQSIIIPDNVTRIGDYAFHDCHSLSNLTLNEGVFEIGERAFFSTNLKHLVIPNSVHRIGGWAFENYNNNPSLESLVLGESLVSVLSGAFLSQTDLKKVTCLAVNPPSLQDQFIFSVYDTLCVPSGSEIAYEAANYWKDFKVIKGLERSMTREIDLLSNKWSGAKYTAQAITFNGGQYGDPETEENTHYNEIVGVPGTDAYGRDWFNTNYSCNWQEMTAPLNSWCTDNVIGDIYARRTFYYEGALPNELYLACGHDDAPCEYYLNGVLIWKETDGWFENEIYKLTPKQISLLRPGEKNVLAFHVHQNWGGKYADCGLYTSLTNLGMSNKCGDNLTWNFDEESGTLTISGTGNMYDNPIWGGYHSQIKHVIIQHGVTNIGERAFDNCHNLTSISIPESVTSIGGWAFFQCGSLTSITIPSGLKIISFGTFEGCRELSSITIPVGVTDINECAFAKCSNLTTVIIPNSVMQIRDGAFYGCFYRPLNNNKQ